MCLAAFARHFAFELSALHMEADAVRACILLAIHQNFNEFDLECDCFIAVNSLINDVDDVADRSEARCIIEYCKS